MKYMICYDDGLSGFLTCDRPMTDEEICEAAGFKLARTQDELEHAPENGMYDLETLKIVEVFL